MDLWIRSQDGKLLKKADTLWIEEYEKRVEICHGWTTFGIYKTKERALQILDEIQDKLKNKYLAKVNPMVQYNDFERIIKQYEEFNGIDLIGSNQMIDITPINRDVLVYEMPKE